ncbi:PAS domain S-box-containing protein [Tistlia consotensis]|uniref:PAS domain S-box-containing protein n=1 Tax=Tistlia consotensis USBA 355 TaxID=560819 RepID=A0A1Y6BXA3_9PROT|nr:PAS domain-containing protein [Tistlia consotensis]SMF29895.1 PAS domain S-box-containing protein [Tistlia consotensis USBA 355]SNR90691.1 PAS domain S-box-containing protein [Tistlia consotensis]
MLQALARGERQVASRKLSRTVTPTGRERLFRDDEVIVSKTDLKGRITYVNRVFLKISGFDEDELIGAPHSIIRHPEMPRSAFKLLWDSLAEGREVFAYINNLAKNGDNYWVFAHVTPSIDVNGKVLGYHSNRRVPDRQVLNDTIVPLYAALLAEENGQSDRKAGLDRSYRMLLGLLEERGVGYDEFIFSL